MSSTPKLKLDWCSAKAARFACETWHYSESLPASGVKIGVWEGDRFVGAVVYGLGSGNATRGERYGLSATHDVAELMRVALAPQRRRAHPTSRVVAISMKLIERQSPDLKMLISFADYAGQGHTGTIYQATNWYYLGTSEGYAGFRINGETMHNRTVGANGWKQSLDWLRAHVDPNAERIKSVKHRYAYPLTDSVRETLEDMAQPYP